MIISDLVSINFFILDLISICLFHMAAKLQAAASWQAFVSAKARRLLHLACSVSVGVHQSVGNLQQCLKIVIQRSGAYR